MKHAVGGDPHGHCAPEQADDSTPNHLPERTRRERIPTRMSYIQPETHRDHKGEPSRIPKDASPRSRSRSVSTFVNILQSPTADAEMSNLELPPIQNAIYKSDSLGNAPSLAPHLVQSSKSTQGDTALLSDVGGTQSTWSSLLQATGPELREFEGSLVTGRLGPSGLPVRKDGVAGAPLPVANYFDHRRPTSPKIQRNDYSQGGSWQPAVMQRSLDGHYNPSDWLRDSEFSDSRWTSRTYAQQSRQLRRLRTINADDKDTSIPSERWTQYGSRLTDDSSDRVLLRPRPRTYHETHGPRPWFGEDSTSRTRSRGESSLHNVATFPQTILNDGVVQNSQNTAFDIRHLAAASDSESSERMWIAGLERRRDDIATLTTELLSELEGPPETRRERLRRVQRSSHGILRQVEDLENFANASFPGRALSSARPAYQHLHASSTSVNRTNDPITRLQQTDPQAAEQAARDMAAIRARTHGNGQRPLAMGNDKGN